jgi:hypothetical protein
MMSLSAHGTSEATTPQAKIASHLAIFHPGDEPFEVRAIFAGGNPACRVFSNVGEAAAFAAEQDAKGPTGTYFTPNVARANLKSGASCKDKDIVRRHWLLVDVDAKRDAGTSSTDSERQAARKVIEQCHLYLAGAELVGPVAADSGNGFHLCYPIDLANDDAAHALIKAALSELAALANSDTAHVDTGVHNASRIWKAYGTMVRKGTATAERPWRLSAVLSGLPWESNTAQENNVALAAWVEMRTAVRQMRQRPYAESVLRKECDIMAGTPSGRWNPQLNKSSFKIGTLVQPGVLTYEEAFAALCDAAKRAGCDNPTKDHGCIARGLRDGAAKPRDLSSIGTGRRNGQAPTQPTAESPRPATASARPTIQRASTITPKRVEWLWFSRIPRGALTLFVGNSGIGKTFAACDIIGRITSGGMWPDRPDEPIPRGQALFLSGDDEADVTLVPRLKAAGADLDRVCFLTAEAQANWTIKALSTLDAALAEMGPDVDIVVIDPPTSFLGNINDHRNAELRGALTPLKNWAADHRVAMGLITHCNKSDGKLEAMSRVMGSVAWVTAVRAAFMFATDEHDESRQLFLPLKMNLARKPKGLAYRIVDAGDLLNPDMGRVEWLGEVETTADQAMRSRGKPKEEARGPVAAKWLIDRFREKRSWYSEDLKRLAKASGISNNAIFEAKKLLDLPKAQKGLDFPPEGAPIVAWQWVVPPDWPRLKQDLPIPTSVPGDTNGTVGTLETVGDNSW